ncbi:MAG: hypothetical protein R6U89_06455 [Dehalococcoidia bacterium]
MHQKNIRSMYSAVEHNQGFDAVIVVSSSKSQAEYWQERLEASRGTVTPQKTRIISVEEDWPGGAGQLLGTLYAWSKANRVVDLNRIISGNGTVAMYHTAGKGTRMAPLPAAESNNKSAIKLPRMIDIDGSKAALTVLEAVIFQTGIFATSREGRLCVFWGDQVFIPSNPIDYDGEHHAEILDIRSEIPASEDEWSKDWQSYGLIIPAANGEVLQREKQSWSELREILNKENLPAATSGGIVLGKSLGCFTVSSSLLHALVEEFSPELGKGQGKLDTDPHLWMPLTSTYEDFTSRGGDGSHWERINRFRERFKAEDNQELKLFGDKDIGAATLWWDYGQVQLYHQNLLKALEDSFEGDCIRQFFHLNDHRVKEERRDGLETVNSIVIESHLTGRINNCIAVGTRADDIDASDSVLIDSVVSNLKASGALIYKCIHLVNAGLPAGEVVTDTFLPSHGRIRMRTDLKRDGKEDWENPIPGNPCSFAELTELIEGDLKG